MNPLDLGSYKPLGWTAEWADGMQSLCEHDWRVDPAVADFKGRHQVVCLNCWASGLFSEFESRQWPYWEEEDYWNNLDAIEGDLAPEIRRLFLAQNSEEN